MKRKKREEDVRGKRKIYKRKREREKKREGEKIESEEKEKEKEIHTKKRERERKINLFERHELIFVPIVNFTAY